MIIPNPTEFGNSNMAFLKLKFRLYYIAFSCGLLLFGALTVAAAANTASSGLHAVSTTRTAKQGSWVNRGLAIGAGAIAGAVVYSIATKDWRWAWGIWGLVTSTTRRIVGSGTAARVAVAGPGPATRVAASAGAPAARVARASASSILTWANFKWGQRMFMVSASALTGAVLANSMYGKD